MSDSGDYTYTPPDNGAGPHYSGGTYAGTFDQRISETLLVMQRQLERLELEVIALQRRLERIEAR